MIRRRLEMFTDAGGSNAVVFTDINEEWEPSQELHAPRTELVGADYAHDQLGASRAIKGVATETVRFEVVADSVAELNERHDAIRSQCAQNGRGKLWSMSGTGERRWCWARAQAMPQITLGFLNITWMPVSITFDRLSDWYAEDETVIEERITSNNHGFTVPNDGNAAVRNAVIEIRSHAVNGFRALTLESLSTGDSFSSTRVAQGSQSRLRMDCGKRAVEYSNDGGAAWTPDYGNFSYGPLQVDFLRLEPGSNSLRYSQSVGTPNITIVIRYYAAFD